MNILVDSSVIIDYLRRKDSENSLFVEIKNQYSMVVSFVTVTELFSGSSIKNPKTRDFVEKILSGMIIKLPDFEDIKNAGLLREQYNLSLGDGFIAQLAVKDNLQLATLDKKDFGRVKGIKLYE